MLLLYYYNTVYLLSICCRFAGGPQYEDIDDFEDFEDDFDVDGDDSDFEDSSSKRKRSKKKDSTAGSRSGSRRSGRNDDIEKTFLCERMYCSFWSEM